MSERRGMLCQREGRQGLGERWFAAGVRESVGACDESHFGQRGREVGKAGEKCNWVGGDRKGTRIVRIDRVDHRHLATEEGPRSVSEGARRTGG
eukprot:scaffold4173_cov117-Isochrysis_galbana.AAC.14